MTANPLDWLIRIHGNGGWVLVYAVVAVPLAMGLIRGRAPGGKIAFFPVLALPVTGLAVLFVSMLRSSLLSWAPNLLTARAFELIGLATLMLFGYLGGLAAVRRNPTSPTSAAPASKTARACSNDAVDEDERGRDGHALTLAGIPIPAMDETKHFKMIGTTGTGKSTAIRELLEGALDRGDRAVIADPDGGYLTRFYDPDARRRDPESLRSTRPPLEYLRRADREPRRRTTRTFPDPRPRRCGQELARLLAYVSSPPSHARPMTPASAI